MKRSLMIAVLVLATVALGAWLWRDLGQAQERAEAVDKAKDRHELHTSGSATIRVKPDSARVFFRVETYETKIETARAENNRLTRQILDAVGKLKIAKLRMKSGNVNIALVIDQRKEPSQLPKVLGYHLTNTFTVLVEDEDAVKLAESAGRVLDTALEQGATGVDQIVFFKKDVEGVRREALTKAVEDALANARALATGANRKVADIITINGEPRYGFAGDMQVQNVNDLLVARGGSTTPLVAGDLEVTCNVSLTCRH
jgi:uncharacterized protein